MYLSRFLAFVVFLALGNVCDAAKILVFFPMPGKSHHIILQPILRQLASRGHSIDYFSPIPMFEPCANVTLIQTRDFVPDIMESLGKHFVQEYSKSTFISKLEQFHEFYGSILEQVCKMPELQRLIKSNEKYDLVIHEGMFLQDYANVFSHKFKIPSVTVIPGPEFSAGNEFAGLPDNPSYMTDLKTMYDDRMTFFERLDNAWRTTATVLAHYYSLYAYQKKVDECFQYPGWESRPSLPMLASDNALILSNSHHSFGFPYPRAPHFKEIGGVNVVPNKPLPEDLKTFLNEAKDGAIYFSLGSVTDMSTMLDPRFKDIFERTFARLKERVLWKWNGESWETPKNVKLQKWFPQQDVLAHENIKLFISHGGIQSTFETVHFGVPVLVIPLFGDQPKNARRIAHFGFGDSMNWDDVTEDTLYSKIRTLIDDSKYKNEAKRRSALVRDRPIPPAEEAAYWIEYVVKHGRVLQPTAVHLSFVQLHLIDVYAFIGVALIVAYCLVKSLCLFVTKAIRPKPSLAPNKKRQ